MDSLQEIYINMANGIKTKISEIDEKVLNSGLVEIKGDYVELNFEGIKLIAQRIAEKCPEPINRNLLFSFSKSAYFPHICLLL
ncbi:MAG: hypothetical protein OWQ47_02705 [Acidianus infernus]|nr:hypothetical protein [Acidianus infernus]